MDPLFEGSGLGSLRRAYEDLDWATTPLGPVAGWSPTLRATVALVMNTRFGSTIFWGPEFVLVYNETYARMIGDKHPAALGAPARDVFPEVWDAIGPLMISVARGDGATWTVDQQLFLTRRGFAEETYFTYSYSPVADADGVIEGVIDIATETTGEVVDRRRLALLARLTAALVSAATVEAVVATAEEVLRGAVADISAADVVTSPGADPPDGEARIRLHGRSLAARGAVLSVRPSPHHLVDEDYRAFLRLAGTAIAQALDRVDVQQTERHTADLERLMSESLQRSLLGDPEQSAGLQVVGRYLAAAEQAQIGGDWFDSFVLPDGTHQLVVGDVTGHDRQAAATMGQVRNLLRGIAYGSPRPPAAALTALDMALHGLRTGALATTVLADVGPGPSGGRDRMLRWSNAGHPPPVLVEPSGHARLLRTEPDLMLGVRPEAPRRDHVVALPVGSSVVFYTDGLVERRGTDLDDQLGELVRVLQDTHTLELDAMCDRLLDCFRVGADDDIVLLVLRVTG